MSAVDDIQSRIEKDLRTGYLSLMILMVISKSKEPTYGYEILKSIEKLTDGRLNIMEGTLYVLLKSLQNQKLLRSYWGRSTKGGPPRRYYEITASGERMLEIGLNEWENLIDIQRSLITRLEGGK
jgi:PadR family transcriptional regulator PadR